MAEVCPIMRKLCYENSIVEFKMHTYVDIQRIDVVCTPIVYVNGLLQDNSVYLSLKIKCHMVSEK